MEALEQRVPCTRRLRRGESLTYSPRRGLTLMCCAGSVEIAVEGAAVVTLAQGGCFTIKRDARVTVSFFEGVKDEWLADTGIAVVAFLPLLNE